MTALSGSPAQNRLFAEVWKRLGKIGYKGDLLQRSYTFSDVFENDAPEREAAAAAFGQLPAGHDSACFAVLISNGQAGPALIREHRALGAPLAFEIRETEIVYWRVSAKPSAQDEQQRIPPDSIDAAFQEHEGQWKPEALFRAKNIGAPRPRQLDFIDLGLIPALEQHVRERLEPLLTSVLHKTAADFRTRHGRDPEWERLYRLVFRLLYGKVMCDRGVLGEGFCAGAPSAESLLQAVGEHYGDPQPVLEDPITRRLAAEELWKSVSFKNLSVEVLAFIWENLLVTEEDRDQYSIHATPRNLARYMVHRLPLDEIPQDERRIVEPCCGSGTFLIAAMQRLRELLPPGTPPQKRHAHFVQMLSGFDLEQFGLEVAKPSLMLADFPNPNGWRLQREDVFGTPDQSPGFFSALREARVVLCNPPFKDFSVGERSKYTLNSVRKPIELLTRVLDNLRPDGILGFVLPSTAVDGSRYGPVRRRLAERFSELEVVRLPEGVFNARLPTILLLAKKPSSEHGCVYVSYSKVDNPNRFLRTGVADECHSGKKPISEVQASLVVTPLDKIWERLMDSPTLSTAARIIQRGVEWERFNEGLHVSSEPKRGYVPGFHTADEIYCFETPPLVYLWDKKEDRKYRSWDLPWSLPKVVCNAVRRTFGPWRLAACPVDASVICSQNFTVMWPSPPWTARSMAAVLNGPVACAYVATHESWKHVRKGTFGNIPLPSLDEEQIARIDKLVKRYQNLAAIRRDFGSKQGQQGLFGAGVGPSDEELQNLLLEIDTEVLHGYDLTEQHWRDLRDFFQGAVRPVPFPFDEGQVAFVQAPRPELLDQAVSWELLKRALEEDNCRKGAYSDEQTSPP